MLMIILQQEGLWMLLELVKPIKYCLIPLHLLFSFLSLFWISKLLSFSPQEAIFRVVAAILHLGNVLFSKGKDIDSSVLKDDNSKFHLQTVSELLMYEQSLDSFFLYTIFLLFFEWFIYRNSLSGVTVLH